ncbi:MAG: glycogen synthase [Nonlabens sp.]|nr:glycogen synthase [Nonlabens sp.]
MKVVHISAECYPVAKVGGLADVVGALPKYLNEKGTQASVIMPFYNVPYTRDAQVEVVYEAGVYLDTYHYEFRILKDNNRAIGFDLYFVDIPELLFEEYVYSQDDTKRFVAFQIAALQYIQTQKNKPAVVHCHDHHTGLVPFMMQHCTMFENLKHIPTVLTIHNAQYQGWFGHDQQSLLPTFNKAHVGLLDWDGSINSLAAAIKCAWRVNTVSPSYMEELMERANGLESLLSHERNKCTGILNGIDSSVWNTATDSFLVKNYTVTSNVSGKKANKKWLCEQYDLDIDKPLFVFIGRLVYEKGSDLFPEAFEKILKDGKVSLLLLGSGDKETEASLKELKTQHPENYNLHIGYDESLSRKMYAGADFLLMPSRVEPCGLNQLYSLRYGTIPIVSNVGGLKDTVIDVDNNGYGFVIQEISVTAIVEVVQRAAVVYEDSAWLQKNRKYIMKLDYSWEHAASQYITLYNSLKN